MKVFLSTNGDRVFQEVWQEEKEAGQEGPQFVLEAIDGAKQKVAVCSYLLKIED